MIVFFIKVQAIDADIGNNAMIKYSILNGHESFEIDETSGVISTSGNIDREEVSQYILTVRASDCGNPSMFSDAQVVVIVDDVNDSPPFFSNVSDFV